MEDHRCKCEQVLFTCKCHNSCPVNMCEWTRNLSTDCDGKDHWALTCLCLPVKLPLLILTCLPCAFYNVSRNACSNTKDKNYMC